MAESHKTPNRRDIAQPKVNKPGGSPRIATLGIAIRTMAGEEGSSNGATDRGC